MALNACNGRAACYSHPSVNRDVGLSRMRVKYLLLLALSGFVLAACSPHPGAGRWKSVSDNELGIVDLSIQFDGKAEFVTTKSDIAVWHCFWGKGGESVATMKCVPSTDPERRELYEFVVRDAGRGELLYEGESIATFERQPHQEKS